MYFLLFLHQLIVSFSSAHTCMIDCFHKYLMYAGGALNDCCWWPAPWFTGGQRKNAGGNFQSAGYNSANLFPLWNKPDGSASSASDKTADYYQVSADYILGRTSYPKNPPEMAKPFLKNVTYGEVNGRISSFQTSTKKQLIEYINYLVYLESRHKKDWSQWTGH